MQGGHFGNALQAAIKGSHWHIVKLLLDKGGDYGNALQAALYEGHEQILKLLLDKGTDVNMQGSRHFGNAL